jgi:hypothetical protein
MNKKRDKNLGKVILELYNVVTDSNEKDYSNILKEIENFELKEPLIYPHEQERMMRGAGY